MIVARFVCTNLFFIIFRQGALQKISDAWELRASETKTGASFENFHRWVFCAICSQHADSRDEFVSMSYVWLYTDICMHSFPIEIWFISAIRMKNIAQYAYCICLLSETNKFAKREIFRSMCDCSKWNDGIASSLRNVWTFKVNYLINYNKQTDCDEKKNCRGIFYVCSIVVNNFFTSTRKLKYFVRIFVYLTDVNTCLRNVFGLFEHN